VVFYKQGIGTIKFKKIWTIIKTGMDLPVSN